MSTRDVEGVKDRYFFVASDYYAAGRFAFWAKAMGVCGNLLHHAIEMFLKGHLLLTMTPEKVRDLSHNLPRIWDAFKTTVPDPRLNVFDRTIGNVHAFEALRYPEKIAENGAVFHFEVRRADLDMARSFDKTPTPLPRYLLALEEIDRLVFLLFVLGSRNPKCFLGG